jgi:hypothetical protein
LGKRATAIYLTSIAVCSVIFGMIVDQIYSHWGISAKAMVGQASEVIPAWAQWLGAILVLLLSIKPLCRKFAPRIKLRGRLSQKSKSEAFPATSNCGPT